MVPKVFEPLKFYCKILYLAKTTIVLIELDICPGWVYAVTVKLGATNTADEMFSQQFTIIIHVNGHKPD